MTLEKKEYSFEETSVFVEHLNKYSLDGQLKLVEKIIKLLTEIKEEPKKGTGTPEALKGYGVRDVWSRRVNDKHRLIYEIIEEEKKVKLLAAYGHYEDK